MKRILFLIAAMLIFASVAQASSSVPFAVPLGPCQLHAYDPVLGGPELYGRGQIDSCTATMQIQVCTQVWGGGRWNVKSETCWTSGRYYASKIYWNAHGFVPVCGHTYSSWDWGYANGATNTYWSGPVKTC